MSDALMLAYENTIARLKSQVSTLQAEKEALEGELGRLRDEKMALIAQVNGCKDGAHQAFIELQAQKETLREFINKEITELDKLIACEELAGNKVKEDNYRSKRVAFLSVLTNMEHPTQEPTSDPLGVNSCTHPECGRFYDHIARRMSCTAITHGACACPSVQEQEPTNGS